jgi:predicted component of type VI protein secretion system
VGATGFESLLPSGKDFQRLLAAVRAACGGKLDADLEIEIAAGEEPRARMGSKLGRGAIVLRRNAPGSVRARVPLKVGGEVVRPVYLVSRFSQSSPA